ncbi:class I SAM-dependent rRNA methyltransferase [Truepera radiovictrix]|uniref:rRNA (Guanine-N(2)-)-methyltransferase n=1 Tax=Truepera radiovictrix (strain DSM 17093 / CIP 108686 / LMG 22925 / RQ-24) TaxID=649638 RepID=D7CQK1_TRURR|nr:class I SAM-dependent rRNA methyltransferase [Truepera radiovictrix]ADI14985.1 rRNA (guanine-N(2)-)-methyltransferase [Truepera radiovictrix DSM 17093]WMT56460.1 class I SAM-dependent rRNA methyltransferase [Truepera radiovictrix]
MPLPTLHLPPELAPALSAGHPWVYRNHLPKHHLTGGEWVRVRAGGAEAYGLYDAESAIALRLFGPTPPRPGMVGERVTRALELREALFGPPHHPASETTAYRLLYGEGDFVPGVSADLYERFVMVRTYAPSVTALVPEVVRALTQRLKLRGVVVREGGTLRALWGRLPPPELTVLEHGLKLLANLHEGQKGGLFLDHRDNRLTLSRFTAGKTVLNLFAYTGAFSLYAVRGGAAHVTSVDLAPRATEDARRNFALNGFAPDAHRFLTADVFALLADYARGERRFDVVILDPPALAKRRGSRYSALRAYEKLNALALRCTQPGGLLATASCTAQVSPEAFRDALSSAAAHAGVRLQLLHEAGQPPDHPVPASFPEGRYLKFVIGRVLPR